MKRISIILIFVSLLFFACSRDAITVNGEGVSKKIYNAVVRERIEAHKAMGLKFDEKAIKRSVVDELIAEVIFLKEAGSKKIEVKDEVRKVINAMRGDKKEEDFKKRSI